MAIDTGGHKTQSVYNYCRKRAPKVMAIKGASEANRPVISRPKAQDVAFGGQTIPGGVMLWLVGTDTSKSTIYSRLKLSPGIPGSYHWPTDSAELYFMGLTAEKLVTRFVKGFPRQEWHKIRERNDYLDCEVYAYAAAVRAGVVFLENKSVQQKNQRRNESERGKERGAWLNKREKWLG